MVNDLTNDQILAELAEINHEPTMVDSITPQPVLGYELQYLVELKDDVLTIKGMGKENSEEEIESLQRTIAKRVASSKAIAAGIGTDLEPGCTSDPNNSIIATIRSRNNAYVCCELHPGAIEVYRVTSVKNINRLALDGICNRDALRANFGKDGWMSHIEELEKYYGNNFTISNLRLVPTERFESPQGVYYKYAMYHVGDPLDYSSVVDGVRIAAYFQPRLPYYLYATKAILTSHDAAARYISRLVTPTWFRKGPKTLPGYSAYSSDFGDENSGFHKEVLAAFSDPASMHIVEMRGMADGAVQTVMVSGFYNYAARFSYAQSAEGILSDYAAIRKMVQSVNADKPCEKPTYELMFNRLVITTLFAILSNNMLIIANARFYRRLKHLGLIVNCNELISNENRIHIWRLLAEYRPDLTNGETYLRLAADKNDPIATLVMLDFKDLPWSRLTNDESVHQLECMVDAETWRVIEPKFRVTNVKVMEKQHVC